MSLLETMEVGDDDLSSSGSDDDMDQELINKAEKLEGDLLNNKYLYDTHLELIGIYRKLTDLTSMRAAYQRFHECFPLTPKIWLEWIKDEIKLASTAEEQKEIFKLFDKAVEDYSSVDLWIEYAQYALGAADLETTRQILERGLTAVGLHTTQGSLLWDTLREIENAHLSLSKTDSEAWKSQVSKLAEVFRRQLSVPLMDMENTYSEFKIWHKSLPEGLVDPKPMEWGYKKAIKTLEAYKPFEEKLLVTEESDLYNVYKEYIKILQDPSAMINVYERAALPLCLNPIVWLDYCSYCFKLGEAALKVCNRALRNCPWSEDLWIMKLRILENLEKEPKEVLATFEQAISSINPPGLELWLSYLEYVKRTEEKVEKTDKLFNQAIEQFSFDSDPGSKLNRWYARILARRGDMNLARKLWKGILKNPNNRGMASVWLEYINLERQYGEPNEVRALFQRAVTNCSDWPQFISEEWIMYEREFGKLQDMMKCQEKCKEITQKIIDIQPVVELNQKADVRQENKGKKRKNDQNSDQIPRKRVREVPQIQEEPIVKKIIEKDPSKTVFVSNLLPSATEEKLKQMFPNAAAVEIVFDKKGKSRCFGYVQFKMDEEVLTALSRDREPLDGRPTFISNCKPDKNERKHAFKYAANEEKNKLFVKGLPVSKNQEQVEEIFKPYGAVAVRLVIHKSGQPKGLAYIEFPSQDMANKALKTTDQMVIDEHTISVAISAPPPKKSGPPPMISSKPLEPRQTARARIQVPLLPRSIQVAKPESGNGTASKTQKSNADFRNMLLKK